MNETTRKGFHADPERENWIDGFTVEGSIPPGEVRCTDPDHVVEWSGAALYLARKRRGISRAAVRDELRRRGFDDASVVRVARLERDKTEPTVTEARALAAILEAPVSAFFACGRCEVAEYLRRNPHQRFDPVDLAPERGLFDEVLVRVRAARRASGVPLLRFATLAGVPRRDVVAIETANPQGCGVNGFVRAIDFLGLNAEGMPAPAETTADVVVAETDLVGAGVAREGARR